MLKVIADVLPRANGYRAPDCGALLTEVRHFGVGTAGRFRRLLSRHRRALRVYDRSALKDRAYLRSVAEEHGDAELRTMLLKQRCFSWEALVRTAMELEFGSAYYEQYGRG